MKIFDSRFPILECKEWRPFPEELRTPPDQKLKITIESKPQPGSPNRKSRIQNLKSFFAFSLVEVLAAVALIGIITFLALPNIVRIKSDSEQSLAIARAEALNLSMASYLQANGQTGAIAGWSGATTDAARYALLAPYLAYAPTAFTDYMPGGYSVTLPTEIINLTTHRLTKAALTGPGGAINY
jgi:type II secretory pathway pseudopilin PulG